MWRSGGDGRAARRGGPLGHARTLPDGELIPAATVVGRGSGSVPSTCEHRAPPYQAARKLRPPSPLHPVNQAGLPSGPLPPSRGPALDACPTDRTSQRHGRCRARSSPDSRAEGSPSAATLPETPTVTCPYTPACLRTSEPPVCRENPDRTEGRCPIDEPFAPREPPHTDYAGRNRPVNGRGGRPPGRPRIATAAVHHPVPGRARRGGRPPGRPRIATRPLPPTSRSPDRGGRPPGRPRIATPTPAPPPARCCSGGGRPPGRPRIATPPRRGSTLRGSGGGRPPGRPRIATLAGQLAVAVCCWWRSSPGTTEDRNSGADEEPEH